MLISGCVVSLIVMALLQPKIHHQSGTFKADFTGYELLGHASLRQGQYDDRAPPNQATGFITQVTRLQYLFFAK